MSRDRADPVYLRFCSAKRNAKFRGIEWRLAYWEWLQIWQDSGHLIERGERKGGWVMARNGDIGPYAAGNVKIVRCETNNEAAARDRHRAGRRKDSGPSAPHLPRRQPHYGKALGRTYWRA